MVKKIKIFNNFKITRKFKNSLILIGNFDGLHSGHQKLFKEAQKYKNKFKIMLVPNITNISYGRGVGYKIEEVILPEKIQQISATKIRDKMRKEGKIK